MSNENNYWEKLYEQAEYKPLKFLHADGTIDENSGAGGGSPITSEEWLDVTSLITINENLIRTIGDAPTIELSNYGRLRVKMNGEYNIPQIDLTELGSDKVFIFSVPNATNLINKIKEFSNDLYEFLKTNRTGQTNSIVISGNVTNGEITICNFVVNTFRIASDTAFNINIDYKFIISNIVGSGSQIMRSAGTMVIQF